MEQVPLGCVMTGESGCLIDAECDKYGECDLPFGEDKDQRDWAMSTRRDSRKGCPIGVQHGQVEFQWFHPQVSYDSYDPHLQLWMVQWRFHCSTRSQKWNRWQTRALHLTPKPTPTPEGTPLANGSTGLPAPSAGSTREGLRRPLTHGELASQLDRYGPEPSVRTITENSLRRSGSIIPSVAALLTSTRQSMYVL